MSGAWLLIGRIVRGADWPARVPASLSQLAHRVRLRLPWSTEVILSFVNLMVLFLAATTALMLAIDGRHRDFATLAFWLPALAFLASGVIRAPAVRYAEEAWFAMVLVVAGVFAIDHYANWEAWAWTLCCWALAAPWAGAMKDELLRLKGVAFGRAN